MIQGRNHSVGTRKIASAIRTRSAKARPRRMSELGEEADVVLEEQPDLGNAVPQHGDAFEAHSKREAGDLLRIVADRAEHVRMHHAGAQHLEPARTLAHAAALLDSL